YVTVSQVAKLYHAIIITVLRKYLNVYDFNHPGHIYALLAGSECKLLIPRLESERHPDVAVYLTKPKGPSSGKMWRTWIPELVIEVVSARSEDGDYVEKREEYWTLGVKEYWIVDAQRAMVVMLRRGKSDWIEKRLGPDDVCATKLLPGFKLACQVIFDAAAEAGGEE
ncbi:MAG: Uma2 family endonuclease, partial [Planctomycetes bacterium]|nr:Uma2 family endonuclease [Planctomycetota bacterium]